jgi:hypothetical protein
MTFFIFYSVDFTFSSSDFDFGTIVHVKTHESHDDAIISGVLRGYTRMLGLGLFFGRTRLYSLQ